jgi:hypothetical protein
MADSAGKGDGRDRPALDVVHANGQQR